MITGEVDDSNLVVNENVVLSKNGASQLIDQLRRYLNQKSSIIISRTLLIKKIDLMR